MGAKSAVSIFCKPMIPASLVDVSFQKGTGKGPHFGSGRFTTMSLNALQVKMGWKCPRNGLPRSYAQLAEVRGRHPEMTLMFT